MSDDVVIHVENLGKKYVIGHETERERYVALRDVMARGALGVWRKTADMLRGRVLVGGDQTEEFWALRNVSFEVKRGEVLGVIGRNGAGKSTLLKILSRITEPSEGRVSIKGRVASLLEVGTGFHPELTGRENIYLNGAILGMSHAEIRRKFDEIVAFAEIETFLDTPVKRYSSGMYVRLAFAVAAHLESEIVLVDEVLAVGDTEFQRKCLGKMNDVAGGGRTVLFVSHNLAAVQSLCSQCALLAGGRRVHFGAVDEAIIRYAAAVEKTYHVNFSARPARPTITSIRLEEALLRSGDLRLQIGFSGPFPLSPPVAGVVISTTTGMPVFGTDPRLQKDGYSSVTLAAGTLELEVRKLPLVPGNYRVSIWLSDWHQVYDSKLDILEFEFLAGERAATKSIATAGPLDWPSKWHARG